MAANNKPQTNLINWSLFKRLIALALPFKSYFIAATFLAIALAAVKPIRPYLVKVAIDDNILANDGAGLLQTIILLVVFLIANVLIQYFFIFTTNFLGQSIIRDLRINTFNKLVNLRLRFFDKTPIGTATTRTINDIETINQVFSQGIITIISDILGMTSVLAVMLWIDWRLTLMCLITMPVMIYATYLFKESVKKSYQKVRVKVAELNAFVQEHISGMNIIQAFTAEKREFKKFNALNEGHRDANISAIWAYSIFFPVVEIITATSLGILVWYGAHRVLGTHIQVGVLVSFIMYFNLLFRPLRMLADKFNTIQMGMVAAERVFNIIDKDENIVDNGTFEAQTLKGDISFKNVHFAYDGVNEVLKGISFEVKAGETLAIVGATGAGKSSLINILTKLYPIQSGEILVDGINIDDYKLSSLRQNIGLVMQDVFLFSGNIYENITLRDDTIEIEKVKNAAKEVGADEFIEQFPEKYFYDVRERGATLSVGQRQLIAFIRAFVQDPAILILDEATSSVDTESEILIQNATEKLVKGRTSILIAHRLSTIQNADKIIVLDKGEIVEMGSHQELLAKDGYYRNLHDIQFSKEAV